MAEVHNCRINVTRRSIEIFSIVSFLLKHNVSESDFHSIFDKNHNSVKPPNNNNNNLDWGPVPRFAPWKHCSQCGLLYFPVTFLNVPALAARCFPRPQPAVVPYQTKEELWARNGGQMVPGICTQGSFTCRKSATWNR
jgi:hypothetical protein